MAFRPVLGLVAALAALLPATPVAAFECSRVPPCPEGDPQCARPRPLLSQAWNQRCVPFWVRRDDPLFGPGTEALVERAIARWTTDLTCTDVEVLFLGYTDETGGFDVEEPDEQRNVLFAARSPQETARWFDDPDLLALTLTTFSVETGEIFDADIAFNADATNFGVVGSLVSCIAEGRPFDIENTLVHELGHFFGFDHVDDTSATMYERAERCETLKRDLAPDDVLGMCTVYPAGEPTNTCHPPQTYGRGGASQFREQCDRALEEGCTCATAGGNSAAPLVLGLGFLGMLLHRRRRR